jgi:hypothetical protein
LHRSPGYPDKSKNHHQNATTYEKKLFKRKSSQDENYKTSDDLFGCAFTIAVYNYHQAGNWVLMCAPAEGKYCFR